MGDEARHLKAELAARERAYEMLEDQLARTGTPISFDT
jgi:hypothetical protein